MSAQETKPKFLYLLPNFFTIGSLFLSFYAITLLTAPVKEHGFVAASVALLFAALCDLLDGRVARLTGTQSDFGFQMDSLIDLVSFGIAPALLVYRWALEPFGIWGLLFAFSFAGCGACRLARFNVMESKPVAKTGPSRYFQGLPIPVSAATLISIVLLSAKMVEHITPQHRLGMLFLTLTLSFLMVSNIRFRTYKDVKVNSQSISVAITLFLVLVVAGVTYTPLLSLVLLFASFTVVGLISEFLRYCVRAWGAAGARAK